MRSKSPEVLGVLFTVKRFSFSFCICQGSHPPLISKEKSVWLTRKEAYGFWDEVFGSWHGIHQVLELLIPLFRERRVDGLEWDCVEQMGIGGLLIHPLGLSFSVGHMDVTWMSESFPAPTALCQIPASLSEDSTSRAGATSVHKGQTRAMPLSGTVSSRTAMWAKSYPA